LVWGGWGCGVVGVWFGFFCVCVGGGGGFKLGRVKGLKGGSYGRGGQAGRNLLGFAFTTASVN